MLASTVAKWSRCSALLVGCAGAAAQAPPVPPTSPAAEAAYVFQCRLEAAEDPFVLDVPLGRLRLTTPTELDRPLELPSPLPAIRLTRFLPHAALEQMAVPADAPDQGPAVLLAIEGPKQSFQRWLLAADAERNRLVSLIGLWRFMAARDGAERDELFSQFKTELSREPILIVGAADSDAVVELPLRIGEVQSVRELGCTVRVLEFQADRPLEPAAREVGNPQNRQAHPAARVAIEKSGQKEERWVYARRPEAGTAPSTLPQILINLDCPPPRSAATPDFVLVSVAAALPELFMRSGQSVAARPVNIDERVEIPGSRYTFKVTQFLSSARLHEEYQPSDTHGAPPALRIEVAGSAEGTTPVWLELGKRRMITTPRGPMAVSFKLAGPADPGAHP